MNATIICRRSRYNGLTASAEQHIMQRCLQAGMNDCLFKPLNLDTLLAQITHCPRRTPNAPDSEAAVTGQPAADTAARRAAGTCGGSDFCAAADAAG